MPAHGTKTRNPHPAPFEHVVAATDFSPGATLALARAARLPLTARGRITIVHALSDGIPQKARADAEKLARERLEQAVRSVRKAAAALGRRGIAISADLCHGQTYVEIIRHARGVGAELIVLGRHGRRPFRDMFIGSTAERVIRAGDLPVLVVHGRADRGYRRPLLAIDLEDTCRSVVAVALRVAGPDVASATMIHAAHVPFEGFIAPVVSAGEMTALRKEYSQTAGAGLAKLEASFGELGVKWRTIVVRGEPRAAILSEVVRTRADLLAVGTHGRSGVAHTLLGSIAEWVIRAAACDVLVARPARMSFELP